MAVINYPTYLLTFRLCIEAQYAVLAARLLSNMHRIISRNTKVHFTTGSICGIVRSKQRGIWK